MLGEHPMGDEEERELGYPAFEGKLCRKNYWQKDFEFCNVSGLFNYEI